MKMMKKYILIGLVLSLVIFICLPTIIAAQTLKTDLSLRVLPGEYLGSLRPGQLKTVFIEVGNPGAGNLTDILFRAAVPENWQVTFRPDRLDLLVPGSSKIIDLDIIPAADSDKGSYTLNIIADALETSAGVSIFVQVEGGSGYWLWIGVGIAAAAVIGFILVFRKEGRK
jgi:uncharacterized membrane protein